MPKPLRTLLDRARTQLWNQAQWANPDLIYDKLGIFGVAAYLRQCWSPDLTNEILAKYGAKIHPECWPIGPNITIHEPRGNFANLSVGAFAHLGKEVFLDLTDALVIEDAVSVGMRTILLTHFNVGEYPGKPVHRLMPKKQEPTILREGCSVGAGSVVLCGVEIGAHAVVGAGVVVDRDVPPRTIVRSSRQQADYQMPERFFRKLQKAAAAGKDGPGTS